MPLRHSDPCKSDMQQKQRVLSICIEKSLNDIPVWVVLFI